MDSSVPTPRASPEGAASGHPTIPLRPGTVGFREIPSKGRGVVALRTIRAGEVVEEVPAIIIPKKDLPVPLAGTVFDRYLLAWSDTPGREFAIAGGLLMLYNHSYQPNVKLKEGPQPDTFIVEALRDIAPDEEVTFDYNCELWFDPV